MKVYRDHGNETFIDETKNIEGQVLVVGVPYQAIPIETIWDKHTEKEVPEVKLRGTIEFLLNFD